MHVPRQSLLQGWLLALALTFSHAAADECGEAGACHVISTTTLNINYESLDEEDKANLRWAYTAMVAKTFGVETTCFSDVQLTDDNHYSARVVLPGTDSEVADKLDSTDTRDGLWVSIRNALPRSKYGIPLTTMPWQVSECPVAAVAPTTTTSTTTTDMPWGLPWWAWFLICCGVCLLLFLCFACCASGVAGFLLGGKKRSSRSLESVEETVYVVEDVVDEAAPMYAPVAMTAVPMATAAVPLASSYSSAASDTVPGAQTMRNLLFDALDKNQDGQISRSEWTKAFPNT